MERFKKLAKLAAPIAWLFPFMALAAVTLPTGSELTLNKIQVIIETIANWLIIIGVIIAVIFIIFGGVRWMAARGDPAAATKARSAIYHGIWGAVIVLGVGVILRTTAALVTRTFFGAGQ